EQQQPVAGGSVGRLVALDAQPAAQPCGGIGDDVHGADPGAIQASAEQQVERQHQPGADQGVAVGRVQRSQGLQHDEGVRQGDDVQQQAGAEVAFQDPDAEPGAEQEQAQDAELRQAAQYQPAVRLPEAFAGQGL